MFWWPQKKGLCRRISKCRRTNQFPLISTTYHSKLGAARKGQTFMFIDNRLLWWSLLPEGSRVFLPKAFAPSAMACAEPYFVGQHQGIAVRGATQRPSLRSPPRIELAPDYLPFLSTGALSASPHKIRLLFRCASYLPQC